MSKGWNDVQLGDLIEIKHGFAFKGSFFRSEPHGDVLLTPGNFAVGGGFKDDKIKYYDGPVPEDFVLHEGDLLVTMTDLSKQSDTLGYPAFIPTSSDGRRYLHNQRLGRIVIKDNRETDLGYIYYLMCSRAYRNEVLASATGTSVKHTSPDRIKQFQFSSPPISEQRAIAHILGTLDDKIELNRRMNQTLEEMARAVFKSWFVDFDPVRAKAALKQHAEPAAQTSGNGTATAGEWTVDCARAYLDVMDPQIVDLFPDRLVLSELGGIPQGWEIKTLGEDFRIIMGQSPPGGTYNQTGDGIPFYQGRTDFGFRYPGYRMYCTSPKRLGIPGDTLVSVRAPVGDVNVALDECCIGRGVAAVRHKSRSKPFTYYSMRALRSRFELFEADGTVFGALNKTAFHSMPWLAPTDQLVATFDELCSPLDDRIKTAELGISALAAQRDVLLPKLTSGLLRLDGSSDFSDTTNQ